MAKRKDNLVIFVHGFIGKKKTWDNSLKNDFIGLLKEDSYFFNNFDVAIFEYYTTLTNILRRFFWPVTTFIFGIKYKKNLPIEKISDLFLTDLRVKYSEYKTITIVAHSMGGLIAKNAILKSKNIKELSNIKLFFSLASPHKGATLAKYGFLIFRNPNLLNLRPKDNFIIKSNSEWKSAENLPKTIYFYGLYDTIVSDMSAVSEESRELNIYPTDDDHFSITKPKSNEATVILQILKELKGFYQLNEIEKATYKQNILYEIEIKKRQHEYFKSKNNITEAINIEAEIINLEKKLTL